MLEIFRRRYAGCRIGLSDHSGRIYPGLAAAVLGAKMVEVHLTLSRELFGPDVSSSLTPWDLKELVEGIRFIDEMMSHPVDKDALARKKKGLRQLFGKSVVAATDLPRGTILKPEHLALKKPGTGLGPRNMPELIGRRLKRIVLKDSRLFPKDYE
jgi:N-acetylneuraminate synthase